MVNNLKFWPKNWYGIPLYHAFLFILASLPSSKASSKNIFLVYLIKSGWLFLVLTAKEMHEIRFLYKKKKYNHNLNHFHMWFEIWLKSIKNKYWNTKFWSLNISCMCSSCCRAGQSRSWAPWTKSRREVETDTVETVMTRTDAGDRGTERLRGEE